MLLLIAARNAVAAIGQINLAAKEKARQAQGTRVFLRANCFYQSHSQKALRANQGGPLYIYQSNQESSTSKAPYSGDSDWRLAGVKPIHNQNDSGKIGQQSAEE